MFNYVQDCLVSIARYCFNVGSISSCWDSIQATLLCLCFTSLAFAQEPSSRLPTLFPFIELIDREFNEEEWKKVESMVAEVCSAIENKCPNLPYEHRNNIASTGMLSSTRNSKKSARHHSLASTYSTSQNFFNGSAAVVRGDLVEKKGERDNEVYIKNSVVVVSGSIRMSGYIYDSIVIARGPIEVNSYIYNSLVISCYEGVGEAITIKDGYNNHALLVGKKINSSSNRESFIYGESPGSDIRKSINKSWNEVASLVRSTGSEELRPIIGKSELPRETERSVVESLLSQLITSSEVTHGIYLSSNVTEYALSKSQVERLVDAAKSSDSDVKRRILWHAIRMSQDQHGRSYLVDTLEAVENQSQLVDYFNSYTNPSKSDLPILATIYNTHLKSDAENQLQSELFDAMVKMLSKDWSRMVVQPKLSDETYKNPNERDRVLAIRDRRNNDASEAREAFAYWIITHGISDSHRIAAYQSFANPPKYPGAEHAAAVLEAGTALIEGSKKPQSKAKMIDMVKPQDLKLYLRSEEPEEVRIAALKVLQRRIKELRANPSNKQSIASEYGLTLEDIINEPKQSKEVSELCKSILTQLGLW